ALFGREDEDGFRVVELARDRLHLRVRQTTRIRNYSERIPAVMMIGEDVGRVEGVRHAPKNVRRAGARGYQWSQRVGPSGILATLDGFHWQVGRPELGASHIGPILVARH